MNGTSAAGGAGGMNGGSAGMNGAGQGDHSTNASNAAGAGTSANSSAQAGAAQVSQASPADQANSANTPATSEDSVASPAAHFSNETGALAPQAVSMMQTTGTLQTAPSIDSLAVHVAPITAPAAAPVNVPSLNVPSFAAVEQSISQQTSALSMQQRSALSTLAQNPAALPGSLATNTTTLTSSLAIGAPQGVAAARKAGATIATIASVSPNAFSEALKSPASITIGPDIKADASLNVKPRPGKNDAIDALNASALTQFGGPISIGTNFTTDLKSANLSGTLNLGKLNFTGSTNLVNGESSAGMGVKLGNFTTSGSYSFADKSYSAALGYTNGPYHVDASWSSGPQKHTEFGVNVAIKFSIP